MSARRTQRRRFVVVLLAVTSYVLVANQPESWAHAALTTSSPLAGAVLDRPPSSVRLSFSEPPEASLSSITVSDEGGRRFDTGPPLSAGDQLTLVVPVQLHDRSAYVVRWRTISEVDGHATSGTFEFGVGVLPDQPLAQSVNATTPLSTFELFSRALLLMGLIVLLGHAVVRAVGLSTIDVAWSGIVAWCACAVGIVVLAEAQRRSAGVSFSDLWPTSIGHALIWRAVAVAFAGVALFATRSADAAVRRIAAGVVAVAVAVTVAVHVNAGHAAAERAFRVLEVGVQWAHVVAIGVWIGGLVTLLLVVRGEPSTTKAATVRRFSRIAVFGFVAVATTGVIATLREVESWDELTSTGYGRLIIAKVALLGAIGLVAGRNRWHNVGAALTNLRPLRVFAGAEVVLAFGAILTASALAGSSPPSAVRASPPTGLTAVGHDYATTIKARLTTQSAVAGANRFTVSVNDYDSGDVVVPDRVSLEFSSLDDPGLPSTSLVLQPAIDERFEGLGNDLATEGRWSITARVERDGESVTVPLRVETRNAPQLSSVYAPPGQLPTYIVQVQDETTVEFIANPPQPGRTTLKVVWLDVFKGERPVDYLVLTYGPDGGDEREALVRRLGPGSFSADVELNEGSTRVTATTRSADGQRLRAVFDARV